MRNLDHFMVIEIFSHFEINTVWTNDQQRRSRKNILNLF